MGYLHVSSKTICLAQLIIDQCINFLNIFQIAPLGRAMTFTKSVITW